ncbi:MAG: site-specific integrase [Candidatus Omnitrophica bacterium]|nr:site-specific integrase [Candidatus Omnitrophota bacterium]
MFNKAIEWGKADENPVRKVKLFKENNKRIRYLEKEQIRPFLDACVPHLKSIVIVALHTGMRKSEIFGLKWQNIHLEREIIYILQTKSGERQQVPMSNIVQKTLISVPKHPDSAYIFCNKDGRPYTNVRKSFDAALKKCGIIDFHFHDLRHTFASQLVMAGVDIKTVQELLRHKSIEMTMRYAHLSPDHKKKAVDILGQRISTNIAQTPIAEEAGTIEDLANSLKQAELAALSPCSSVGRAAVS